MKHLIYSLFLICLSVFGNAQIERVIVETYYISDRFDATDTLGGKLDSGSVTYRVFVDLKPGNKLLKIYGDTNHVLKFASSKPFFNNVDGQTYAKDFKKGIYSEGTVPLDSWITLGQTAAKTPDGKANFGILKTQDPNGSFIGGVNNSGGSAAIAAGLLTNSATTVGIPLTTSDGMFAMTLPTFTWNAFGIQDFSSGSDSTVFGSLVPRNLFSSRSAFLQNTPGVSGVIADSNQILIAQLTTKGTFSFELNLEVLQMVNNVMDTVRYVANDDTLLSSKNEKKSSFLIYPFPKAQCGCKDPAFLEYNVNFECASADSCKNRIVFGCMDSMACNFDPRVNFEIKALCCYPGSCGGRDLTVVCPQIRGDTFEADLFPNPAAGSIALNVTSGISHEIIYAVYNGFGMLVLTENLGKKQRVINHNIDLTGLENGVYLARIMVGNSFVSKQFLKNE
jgi:hypothetical protein